MMHPGEIQHLPGISIIPAAQPFETGSYVDQYPLWIRVGFALYDFAPNEVGLALWRRFSGRCPKKAEASDFEALWKTLGRPYAGEKISVGWLWSQALTNGWRANCNWDRSTVTFEDED